MGKDVYDLIEPVPSRKKVVSDFQIGVCIGVAVSRGLNKGFKIVFTGVFERSQEKHVLQEVSKSSQIHRFAKSTN